MNVTDASAVPDRLAQAFRAASTASGTPFDYLLGTAMRESALDPGARAATSSATGLFQFIESTWLQLIKEEGPRHGLGNAAAAIERTPRGGYRVADPEARRAILALRGDPEVSALMAGEFTRRNSDTLSARLGREPSSGELYAAHFLGAGGAAALITATAVTPQRAAVELFPEQAAANRPIFFRRDGVPRSVAEVYTNLTRAPSFPAAEAAPVLAFADPAPALWPAINPRSLATPAPEPAIPGRFAAQSAAIDGTRAASRFAPVTAATAPPPSRFAVMTLPETGFVNT